MLRNGFCTLILPAFLVGCSGETGTPLEEVPAGEPQASEIILQAVDAGTGGALADDEVTVRHLVRYPITLDESGVESAPAAEPYQIEHAIAWDSLVVEVRLEAPSYHRLDTVLSVARGASVGPVTLRMTRQLSGGDRPVQSASRPAAGADRPSSPAGAAPDPDAGIDRTALQTGNQAYWSRDWVGATTAYLSMPEPPRQTGTYAQEYAAAMVRLGASHMNLGEFAGALNALETSVGFPEAPYRAHLLLGQTQCSVGRYDEGRARVAQIDRMAPDIPAEEWGTARALAAYQRANCTHQEFQGAEAALDILRFGGAAIREYEAFIGEGEALSPAPAEVSTALTEARTRIEEIRQRMRTGEAPVD